MTDTSADASVNPFQQSRLLTPERSQLFNRTAETLAERYEDELGRWLSDAGVTADPVEQVQFSQLGEDVDLAVIKSQYQMTHGVIASDLDLALAMVAMLCGGVADPPPEQRPLSRLEMGVLDLVLQPLVDLAVELYDIGPTELGGHFSNALALPDAQPEPVISVPLTIKLGESENMIRLTMSASQLQDYIEEMDLRIAGQLASKGGQPNELIVRAMQPVVVELIAGFEPLQVPARHLADLQVGDVLRTRQSINRPLIARVGEQRLYHIRAAQRGLRLVAELTGHADGSHHSDDTRASSPGPLGGGSP